MLQNLYFLDWSLGVSASVDLSDVDSLDAVLEQRLALPFDTTINALLWRVVLGKLPLSSLRITMLLVMSSAVPCSIELCFGTLTNPKKHYIALWANSFVYEYLHRHLPFTDLQPSIPKIVRGYTDYIHLHPGRMVRPRGRETESVARQFDDIRPDYGIRGRGY